MTMDFAAGEILLIDKPLQWTSFDVVNKIRIALTKHLGHKIKVGHAGTLDPLATGLVLLATGKATKRLEELTGMDKEYTGTITLGATTPSYDLETEPTPAVPTEHLTVADIKRAVAQLTGAIQQVPPIFSAIKQGGKPVYKQARKGKEVDLPARAVVIYAFDILSIEGPVLSFRVHCSKGTYIRSLAHDLGQLLGVGGYLSSLCRTAIGSYRLSDATSVEGMVGRIQDSPVA